MFECAEFLKANGGMGPSGGKVLELGPPLPGHAHVVAPVAVHIAEGGADAHAAVWVVKRPRPHERGVALLAAGAIGDGLAIAVLIEAVAEVGGPGVHVGEGVVAVAVERAVAVAVLVEGGGRVGRVGRVGGVGRVGAAGVADAVLAGGAGVAGEEEEERYQVSSARQVPEPRVEMANHVPEPFTESSGVSRSDQEAPLAVWFGRGAGTSRVVMPPAPTVTSTGVTFGQSALNQPEPAPLRTSPHSS
jgi:hypothetical protein